MGDIMRPVPFKGLIKRIFNEYSISKTIFGIHESVFFRKSCSNRIKIFNEICDTPIGPAAGPHTQLAQNIITSYLTGGRFIELKTVQIMDTLEINKPCIDATDEAYNTEWSTEFTLEKAYNEYIKAWIILHLIEDFFKLKVNKSRSFIFNMSVGYNLEGIKTPRMNRYIDDIIDSSNNKTFKSYIDELKELINEDPLFSSLQDIPNKISPNICKSLTLSTMHGCPPKEIEAICEYMITQKHINTFVKLNPTLLGFKRVRVILDTLGFDYINLKEETFSHDLGYSDAVTMLYRLIDLAQKKSVNFGVKLSNTLGVINNREKLPEEEMYMSGRALFPITINLASKLAEEFNGKLSISYSGGASSLNIKKIFNTGIHPITMATEMLKPGGYLRLKESGDLLEDPDNFGWNRENIDIVALKKLALESLENKIYSKNYRGINKIEVNKTLPLYNCYIAPCTYACPIHQDIPEYIKLVGDKKYKEALEVIYSKNALPSITGYICDHQCMYNCTRLDYEGAVKIREMKKIAVENGFEEYKKEWIKPELTNGIKIAIIGAGPAGLSAAFFLSRNGFVVTIYEKEKNPGGVINKILPKFRIPESAVMRDIDFIKAHGVNFIYNANPDLNIEKLKANGFKYICIGIGAEEGNLFKVNGNNKNIIESLKFLKDYRENPVITLPGKNIAIIGGGNTAMDSARAATRIKGVESVTVFYRRTENEMPADREEYEAALIDGVKFHFLRNPLKFDKDLTCSVMKLGDKDLSGRRKPVATEVTETYNIDYIITAIGEHVDLSSLKKIGITFDTTGRPNLDENIFIIGDANTGPSTVVRCIEDARVTTDKIIKKENRYKDFNINNNYKIDNKNLYNKKGKINLSRNYNPIEVFAKNESSRCLECNYICNKCVDVCPNRANIVIDNNIIHIEAYCNECGNCETFCPYNGAPYKDKLTLFNLEEDYINSSNNGFFVNKNSIKIRLKGITYNLNYKNKNVIIKDDIDDGDLTETIKIIEKIIARYNYLLGPVSP